MGTLREIAYAMREQAIAAHQMMEQMGQQPKKGHGGNSNRAEVDLEYLKKANQPDCQGAFYLIKVEEWIKATAKISFDVGMY